VHWHFGLPSWDHDSQIAITLGTGALEVLGHGGYYRFVLYPNNGHRLPPEDVRKKPLPFSKKPPDRPAVLAAVSFPLLKISASS